MYLIADGTELSGTDIVTGSDNNLWVTGGARNTIWKVTTAGVGTRFNVPTANAFPRQIVSGPDGALWFTETDASKIGRLTTAGVFTEINTPSASSNPWGITNGAPGTMSYVESTSNKIVTLTFPAAPTQESTALTANSRPGSIVKGPDGALWFIENNTGGKIGRIASNGQISEYATGSPDVPNAIVTGPDGNIWVSIRATGLMIKMSPQGVVLHTYTNAYATGPIVVGPDGNFWYPRGNNVGTFTTSGVANAYVVNYSLMSVTVGPDGNLWFTTNGSAVIKMTTAGASTIYSISSISAGAGIVSGSDGNLWIAAGGNNSIVKMSTAGVMLKAFTLPSPSAYVASITLGSDGNFWYTKSNGSNYGRITPNGVVTEYATPSSSAMASKVVGGFDGNIWFTEDNVNKIARVTIDVPAIPSNLTDTTTTPSNPSFQWSASVGALSYDVYRNGTKIASSAATGFTDVAPISGVNTYYVVAQNDAGASAPSSTISITAP